MKEVNERSPQLDNILIGDITPEILTDWIGEDMGLTRESALAILYDEDLIEYGRLAPDHESYSIGAYPHTPRVRRSARNIRG